MVYLDHEALAPLMHGALEARDVDPASIAHVVESLIQTSLRGVDSHGINRFPHYCRAVDGGRVSRRPNIRIERTAAATSIVNADHAFGHHAGAVAIDHARTCAVETGIAAAAVMNSTHFGAAAYFGLRAATRDCVGFAFTNADALVKVHNSTTAFFGTNPLCCCAPMASEDPFFAGYGDVVDELEQDQRRHAESATQFPETGRLTRTGAPSPILTPREALRRLVQKDSTWA